jgi:hypothetical protein
MSHGSAVFRDKDSAPPGSEGWILRSDKIVSKVMLHRFARLYEDRLEIYHLKEAKDKLKEAKDIPELEAVLKLRGSKITEVQQMEVDIKPRGSNLFLGYVSGDIRSRTVVRIPVYAAWRQLIRPRNLYTFVASKRSASARVCVQALRPVRTLPARSWTARAGRLTPVRLDRVQHGFTVQYNKVRSKHKKVKTKELTIAFETADTARAWAESMRSGASGSTGARALQERDSDVSSFASRADQSFMANGHADGDSAPPTPAHEREVRRAPAGPAVLVRWSLQIWPAPAVLGYNASRSCQSRLRVATRRASPARGRAARNSRKALARAQGSIGSMQGNISSDTFEDMRPPGPFELPAATPLDPATTWRSTYHWNGMAVYREGTPRGAHAVACSMKASPKDVFRHFIRLNDGSCAWDLFTGVVVLDDQPDNDYKMARCPFRLLAQRCAARAACCGVTRCAAECLWTAMAHSRGRSTCLHCRYLAFSAPRQERCSLTPHACAACRSFVAEYAALATPRRRPSRGRCSPPATRSSSRRGRMTRRTASLTSASSASSMRSRRRRRRGRSRGRCCTGGAPCVRACVAPPAALRLLLPRVAWAFAASLRQSQCRACRLCTLSM